MPKSKKRTFSGFGVVTRQGRFLWQYLRSDPTEARNAYYGHNPEVEGYPDGHKLVAVTIKVSDIEAAEPTSKIK